MKTYILFFFFGITIALSGNLFAQSTKLTLEIDDLSIREVFDIIQKQSKFIILYKDNLANLDRKISAKIEEKRVDEILDLIFEDIELDYKIIGRQIVIVPKEKQILYDIELAPSQQGKEVKGKLLDAYGDPLYGATVIQKGTINGTLTENDGAYVLRVSDNSAVLVFSFVGMKTLEVSVADRTTINIKMAEETIGLEEIVSIGYGYINKSVLTGSISSINSKDLQNSSIYRAEQALQGRAPGVQVIQNSGAPGAGVNIRIRGYGSNKSSEPIYIVNGTRVSSLSDIDPNDIESIEVLKDAASAAIYGSEGANGVVLVTTKSGKIGKGQITYEYQYSIQKMARKLDVLDAVDYKTYMEEAGTLPLSANAIDFNTDWQDEIFETSPTKKHYLSFTGGSEKGTFMLSASYLDQDGVVVGDKDQYQRYTLMFNSDYKLNNWAKVGHSVTFSKTILKSVAENSEYVSVITSALMLDPLTPVAYTYDYQMSAIMRSNIGLGYNYLANEQGQYYGVSQYVSETANPFVARDATSPMNENNKLMGNVFIELVPFRGLSLTSRLGGNFMASRFHLYQPAYYYDASTSRATSLVVEASNMLTYWQWENFATYMKSFGRHNTTFLLGMSSSENKLNQLYADGSPLTTDSELYDDLDFLATDPSDNVGGSRTMTRKTSYFGRLNYDFDAKYLFQFSLRRDGAGVDILPEDTRWGIFPAVSGGWVLSKESFFPQKSLISFAKIRASWGQNGSLSNLGGYQYRADLMTSRSYPSFESIDGLVWGNATAPRNLINESLKWETSEQTNIGIELRAANNQLAFSMDYYMKKTKDLLTDGTPPLITGNDATTVNAGNVENSGFEFELSYRSWEHDFKYSINGSLATLHNEVTYMNPNSPYLNGAQINLEYATRFDVGHPIWYFYGYKTNGINPDTGNPLYVNTSGETVTTVTSADKQYLGSGIPTITYGLNINLSYKKFDFVAFLQGASGHDVMLGMIRTDRLNYNKLQLFFDDRWTPSNTDASMPSATTESNAWHSDLMIFDGDYLKIKQIQLGYTFSKRLISRVNVSNARVYLSVENVHTFTKYQGTDPEVGSSSSVNSLGIDRGMYPYCRTYLFGATISF